MMKKRIILALGLAAGLLISGGFFGASNTEAASNPPLKGGEIHPPLKGEV